MFYLVPLQLSAKLFCAIYFREFIERLSCNERNKFGRHSRSSSTRRNVLRPQSRVAVYFWVFIDVYLATSETNLDDIPELNNWSSARGGMFYARSRGWRSISEYSSNVYLAMSETNLDDIPELNNWSSARGEYLFHALQSQVAVYFWVFIERQSCNERNEFGRHSGIE